MQGDSRCGRRSSRMSVADEPPAPTPGGPDRGVAAVISVGARIERHAHEGEPIAEERSVPEHEPVADERTPEGEPVGAERERTRAGEPSDAHRVGSKADP